jgi:hypothetical protein
MKVCADQSKLIRKPDSQKIIRKKAVTYAAIKKSATYLACAAVFPVFLNATLHSLSVSFFLPFSVLS